MPFNHIITNPPYNKNLHLKILREAMKHGEEIVNLSPIRWLQDPLAEYKRGSDWKRFGDVRERIKSLEAIDNDKSNKLFGIKFASDLGIYHITSKGGWKGFNLSNSDKVLIKIKTALQDTWANHMETSAKMHFVRTSLVYNPSGGNPHHNILGEDKERQLSKRDEGTVVKFFNFSTANEASNFYDAAFLKLNRFIKKVGFSSKTSTGNFNLLPYLGDYTHPWTDTDLYEYFNLTPEEIQEIENEV
jgi:hypothetical protein